MIDLATTLTTLILAPMFAACIVTMASVRKARRARAEYERACRDYASLVDHRIANPLSAIVGAAATLLDGTVPLDNDHARPLLEMIRDQATRIEFTSLSPRVQLGIEEGCLDAVPA